MPSEGERIAGVPLVVKRSPRARLLRLRLDGKARTVVLTVPRRVSRAEALRWARSREQWVTGALAGLPPRTRLVPGASLPLHGSERRIDWHPAFPRKVSPEPGSIRVGGPEELVEARLLRWLKAHARELLDRETRALAEAHGLAVNKVGVGDPGSRWGSCSSSGSIRYSWRLVLAPEAVRRAVVAHEVAHLRHLHHGPEFHAFAAELLGEDPRQANRWLRREGASLFQFGSAA